MGTLFLSVVLGLVVEEFALLFVEEDLFSVLYVYLYLQLDWMNTKD